MASRVGMSKNPEKRIKHWKDKEGHTRSETIRKGLTYDEAHDFEKKVADKIGAHAHGGGPRDKSKKWEVYKVSGGKIKKSS